MKTNDIRANEKRVAHPLPASRPSIAAPPSSPVRWIVVDREGKRLGLVRAQTWVVARAKAMQRWNLEAHEIRVELERGAA